MSLNLKKIVFLLLIIISFGFVGVFTLGTLTNEKNIAEEEISDSEGGPKQDVHPLSIAALRAGEYPGSDVVIEQTLAQGSNYNRYIASYKSDGLKIYALLTVPNGEKPSGGWPVIIFNHGFIPPEQYRTTERYIAYTDAFSRNGYIVFRADYRGHGSSEGKAEGGYGSNAYTIDVLNAVASMKKYSQANPEKIGMWGHSMGGHITLRSMVASKYIKAGVIWAGVVASYPDLLSKWNRGPTAPTPFPTTSSRGGWRRDFLSKHGTPEENPEFWNSISSNTYLTDISGPVQLHHGTSDHSVPHEFSETLASQMEKVGKDVELYIYPGDEHDIPNNFSLAMDRSVEFFDKYVK